MPLALVAVVFYGILGGFPALLTAGALGGAAARAIGRTDGRRVRRTDRAGQCGTLSSPRQAYRLLVSAHRRVVVRGGA